METTDHPLKTLPYQEIFDKAYLGLKSQGWNPSQRQEGMDEICLYRSDIGHCAIGWVCVGYEFPHEFIPITHPDNVEIIGTIDEARARFLRVLQRAHDAYFQEGMKIAVEKVAEKYGLTIPTTQPEEK